MTIISSQQYIDERIVEEKIKEFTKTGVTKVIVPCWYIGEIDGEEYAIQSDKHHTLVAARELKPQVEYDIVNEPEGITGVVALEAHVNDGDYYNVETSNPYYYIYDMIF